MSFGCERSCSSPRRVSNFNSKVPQGGIYPHIKFERDMRRGRVFRHTSISPLRHGEFEVWRITLPRLVELECSRRQGLRAADAAATAMLYHNLSPNTSFGDIIMVCGVL